MIDQNAEEIWELTIEGRVHVETISPATGRPVNKSAVGKGDRIRLATRDRLIAEERIRKQDLNPFRNGAMVQVGGPSAEASEAHLSDDDLASLFADVKDDEFADLIAGMSEVNVRRMRAMAMPVDASLSQSRMLDDAIEARFKIGGTTPTYEEMRGNPSAFGN